MSKVFMLSSLISGLLLLGAASYKSFEVVQESRCRTFPERCDAGEAIATTPGAQDALTEAPIDTERGQAAGEQAARQ